MRWITATLLLVAAAGFGCAGPYIPRGSRPPNEVHPYRNLNYKDVLPGRWAVIGIKPGQQGALSLPNVLTRSADMNGMNRFTQIQFSNNGDLQVIAANGKTALLNYHIEGNELHIGSRGTHVGHDAWEMAYEDGSLFMRSLEDSEVLTLAPARQSAGTQPAARSH